MKQTTVAQATANTTVVGSLAVVLIWMLSIVHIVVPDQVAVAMTVVLAAAAHYGVALLGGKPADVAAPANPAPANPPAAPTP